MIGVKPHKQLLNMMAAITMDIIALATEQIFHPQQNSHEDRKKTRAKHDNIFDMFGIILEVMRECMWHWEHRAEHMPLRVI